jgi:hypothetical protein
VELAEGVGGNPAGGFGVLGSQAFGVIYGGRKKALIALPTLRKAQLTDLRTKLGFPETVSPRPGSSGLPHAPAVWNVTGAAFPYRRGDCE